MTGTESGGGVVGAVHTVPRGVTGALGLPPRADHDVARPRLDALLAPPDGPTITLVSTHTGWGKTVAVLDWAERAGGRVAWLTLAPGDDHPMRFWHDVLSAFEAVAPGVGRRAFDALAESGGSDDAFVGVLLTDVAQAGRRLVLVLDDLHQVRDRRVLASLEQLLEHAPPLLRFVLITRERPPLPLARWRARGLVGEVSEAALAFRPDEAAALFGSFDVELGDDEVATMADEMEGWVAGLQLVALASRGACGPGTETAGVPAGRDAVADLLAREVLSLQPADVREFLGDTCVVERFDAELCRALTGRDDSQEMLRTIEGRHLFLVPLDGHRRRFRYHRFFRDFLRAELEARDADRIGRLHVVAAEWCRNEGEIRLAVSHLLDAGDTEGAFAVAVAEAPRGRSTRSAQRDWLDLLPPEYVAADPQRIASLVVALVMQSSLTDAQTWLERAETLVGDEAAPGFARRLAAIRAQLAALRGDAEPAVGTGAALLPIDEQEWDDVVFERLPVNLARSYLLLGDLPGAKAMVDLVRGREGLSDVATLVVLPALQANVAAADDRLRDAEALARDALRHTSSVPAGHFGFLDAHLALVRVLLERDDRPAAEATLAQLQTRAADLDSIMHLTFVELAHAVLAWRRDDLEEVVGRLGRARLAAARSEGVALARRANALEARIRVRTGEVERAAALTATLPPSVERELLQARAELTADPASARARLDATQPAGTRDRIVRELLLARAARGEADAAGHLARAVRLAEPERFASVFWEERAPSTTTGPSPPGPAALSARELVVLRHLGGEGTSAQIASELFISRNTLKSHVKAIYRKLGVGSRDEAVASARRLGLL